MADNLAPDSGEPSTQPTDSVERTPGREVNNPHNYLTEERFVSTEHIYLFIFSRLLIIQCSWFLFSQIYTMLYQFIWFSFTNSLI